MFWKFFYKLDYGLVITNSSYTQSAKELAVKKWNPNFECIRHTTQIAANADQEIIDRRKQFLDEKLDKLINGINTINYRPKPNTWMSI